MGHFKNSPKDTRLITHLCQPGVTCGHNLCCLIWFKHRTYKKKGQEQEKLWRPKKILFLYQAVNMFLTSVLGFYVSAPNVGRYLTWITAPPQFAVTDPSSGRFLLKSSAGYFGTSSPNNLSSFYSLSVRIMCNRRIWTIKWVRSAEL